MKTSHYNQSQGFTLIEVLVAFAVFSAVLSLVLFGLEQGRTSWVRGNKTVTFLSGLNHRQFWLDRMFVQANPATFEIDYGTEAPYFLGTNNELSFVTDAPVIDGPGTYSFVKLSIKSEAVSEQSLVLYEWNNRDPYYGLPRDNSQAKKLVLIQHMENAHWEYFLDARTLPTPLEIVLNNFVPRYNSKWSQEYDSRFELKLPKKIRLIFEFKNQSYVWVFNMLQYPVAAGQNESLVLQ